VAQFSTRIALSFRGNKRWLPVCGATSGECLYAELLYDEWG
jgi:hypothetical protein